MIALTNSGALRAATPRLSPTSNAAGAASTTWRVSLSEPLRFSGRAALKHAASGRSAAVAASGGCGAGMAVAAGTRGVAPGAATSSFSLREVALPPGTQRVRLFSSPRAIA